MATQTDRDDWILIKDLFQKGYSLAAIRQAVPEAPHESNICRRAKKEGWIRATRQKPPGTRKRSLTRKPEPVAETQQAKPGKPLEWVKTPLSTSRSCLRDNSDLKVQVIESLKAGSTFKIAAAAAGVNEGTLINWRRADPDFETACRQARAQWAQSRIENVNVAADEDWRAATWLLERHPETRDEFRGAEAAKGGGLTVVLNIPRSDAELRQVQGAIIDQLPEKSGPD